VELFSRLIMEAKLVGIGYTSHEREAMFVGTILGPAFRPVIAEINAVAEANRDWPLVHSKYNAESARRKARPLVRPTAPRGGSKALYDEHESWAGLTVGSEPIQSWADMEDDGKELEPIEWPDEGAIEANPWADMAMFTQDSILLAGEPVQPTWVVDSGATHHITACRELLRDARKLEEPKVFGLADRTASMRASEVGEVHVRLGSGRRITLKDVYYVPASRVSLLSLSSLLKHGWTVDMRDGGGTIKRGKERLTLRKDGPLWTTVVRTVEPLILAAGTGSLGKSVLEEEHQRLGHIGREKLLDLAKAGKLKGSHEDLRKDPFRTDQCEACL
jgi:hypothetical protein